MYRRATLAVTTLALLSFAIALPMGEAIAQQKQQVSFKTPATSSKYTQQHVIDVGDVPGHQVRVYEIQRTYSNNAPMINGAKLVEWWTRGLSDYTNNNGTGSTYSVYTVEGGDKFFARASLVAQSTGAGKLTATTAGFIIGGTGKFAGIQGPVHTLTSADPKAGINESQVDIEYSIGK
jgi:hypothetical protein